MMKVLNAGDWTRQALEVKCGSMTEYEKYLEGLAHNKARVVELGERGGNYTTEHFLLVDGHQVTVYVTEETKRE